jgi:hypothetical protein
VPELDLKDVGVPRSDLRNEDVPKLGLDPRDVGVLANLSTEDALNPEPGRKPYLINADLSASRRDVSVPSVELNLDSREPTLGVAARLLILLIASSWS